jgi:hypothetical protein
MHPGKKEFVPEIFSQGSPRNVRAVLLSIVRPAGKCRMVLAYIWNAASLVVVDDRQQGVR